MVAIKWRYGAPHPRVVRPPYEEKFGKGQAYQREKRQGEDAAKIGKKVVTPTKNVEVFTSGLTNLKGRLR